MKITSVYVIKVLTGQPSVKEPLESHLRARQYRRGNQRFRRGGLCYATRTTRFRMCKDFAELIIGLDPMIFEKVWNKLHRSTFWGMGGGGVIFSGISAIDIALWDIKGKALGVPVYQLLGGKTNDKLRAYASQIQFDWGKECHALSKPEQYCDAARKAIADGYNCIKVDPVGFDLQGRWMGWSNYGILEYDQLKIAVDRVAAIREAGGPALDIIIELHSLTDKKTAIQLGRELEKFRCFYMRSRRTPQPDPIPRDRRQREDPDGHRRRSYSRWGFREFFEQVRWHHPARSLQHGRHLRRQKFCDMAHVYDVGVQIHICGGPISTAGRSRSSGPPQLRHPRTPRSRPSRREHQSLQVRLSPSTATSASAKDPASATS